MTDRDLAQFLPDDSMIRKATVYRARCGMRRAFLSESDALAYEDGFAGWPSFPGDVHQRGTPAMQGWADAERAYQERQDRQAEEHAERVEAGL